MTALRLFRCVLLMTPLLLFSGNGVVPLRIDYGKGAADRVVLSLADRRYFSLTALAEAAGASVVWDRLRETVILTRDQHRLKMVLNAGVIITGENKLSYLGGWLFRRGELFLSVQALRVIYRELGRNGEPWQLHAGDKLPTDRPVKPRALKKSDLPSNNTRIKAVVIDAGHGGRDPGAVGWKNMKESDLVLKIAKKSAARLKQLLPGVKVYFTRKRDRTLSLAKRAAIANGLIRKGYKAIYVSIHANASLSTKRYGFETYYLSPIPSNADARATAALENGALDVDVKQKSASAMDTILSKMLVEEYRRESIQMANAIQQAMKLKIGKYTRNRKVRKANFFVMRQVYMPSVLVEIGFITNPKEAKMLSEKWYQNRVADGIAGGLKKFISLFNEKL